MTHAAARFRSLFQGDGGNGHSQPRFDISALPAYVSPATVANRRSSGALRLQVPSFPALEAQGAGIRRLPGQLAGPIEGMRL